MTITLHPEATTDPRTLRWVTNTEPPAAVLQGLIDDGTLAAVDVGPSEIRTRLSTDRTWVDDGPRVRSALFAALAGTATTGSLRDRVAAVLRREVAPLVDSHGGAIDIVSLSDGVLTVSLTGACGSCTLRSNTLRTLVGNAVRSRFPEIRGVRAVRDLP